MIRYFSVIVASFAFLVALGVAQDKVPAPKKKVAAEPEVQKNEAKEVQKVEDKDAKEPDPGAGVVQTPMKIGKQRLGRQRQRQACDTGFKQPGVIRSGKPEIVSKAEHEHGPLRVDLFPG